MAKKNKRPRPIAPKPIQMKSRKKARQITSLFHKLTRQIDDIKNKSSDNTNTNSNDKKKITEKQKQKQIQLLEQQIEEMGGREEYQRASQLSTKFHSTSKWVLKVLRQINWLYGRPIDIDTGVCTDVSTGTDTGTHNVGKEKNADETKTSSKKKKKVHHIRRPVNILEVGAINTELLTAATQTKRVPMKKSELQTLLSNTDGGESGNDDDSANGSDNKNENEHATQKDQQLQLQPQQIYKDAPIYNLQVRAIDIRSSHDNIEEQDFLTLPITSNYDVIVCSMVLNCVTTHIDRGKMLYLLYQQLSAVDGGLCFLTIPKLCINQSKYMDRELFEEMLIDGIGFEIESRKDTPKVAFWVLKKQGQEKSSKSQSETTKQEQNQKQKKEWKDVWGKLRIIHRGKKYRNDFGVILKKY